MRTRRNLEIGGFTLIEALVVVTIIGLLTAMLLPAVQAAREPARRAHCVNNLRQIGVGLHGYLSTYQAFPIGRRYMIHPAFATSGCDAMMVDRSFLVSILPEIEQASLYHSINASLSIVHASNYTAIGTSVTTFVCPNDSRAAGTREGAAHLAADPTLGPIFLLPMGSTSYSGIQGSWMGEAPPRTRACLVDPRAAARSNGLLTDVAPITPASVTDGLSNTLAVTEHAVSDIALIDRAPRYGVTTEQLSGWWFTGERGDAIVTTYYAPNARNRERPSALESRLWSASSRHPGGLNGLLGDGSVRWIKESIDSGNQGERVGVWQALASRAGGEAIGSDAY